MTLRERVVAAVKAYNPNQPRDEDGQWTEDNSRPKANIAKPHERTRYGRFQFKGNKILMTRLGGVNAVTQLHWKHPPKNPSVLRGGGNPAPVSRGFWASPFAHGDPYLYFHRYDEAMPKGFRRDEREAFYRAHPHAEDQKEYTEQYEKHLKAIRKRLKPTSFWQDGGFYSHIAPPWEKVKDKHWYYWESAREWAKEASKHLFSNYRADYGPDKGKATFRLTTDRIDFEIFVPGVAE